MTEEQLTQGDMSVVDSSTQAINGIALKTDADNLAGGSKQTVDLTKGLDSLKMIQGMYVNQAKQALNYIKAQNIGVDNGVAVQQNVDTPAQETSLRQKVFSSGTGNLQAMNAAEAPTGTVGHLNQTPTVNGSLKLFQDEVSGSSNTQAVNYASGESIGHAAAFPLEQRVTVIDATAFSQDASGGSNIQAGNIAIATTSGITAATQTFNAAALELEQDVDGGGSNIQAVNYAKTDAGDIRELSQTVNAIGVTEFKNDSGSRENIQAGNLADSEGGIVNLEQVFTARNSLSLRFIQEGSGNINIQAGNMARINGGSEISGIDQDFTGSPVATVFRQEAAASSLIQAANLIDLGSGSLTDNTGPHQEFTVLGGTLLMVQSSGSTNLQALNAMVVDTTINPSQVHQTLSMTGNKFLMEQNGVQSSGQFGNFAGVRL